MEATSKSVGKMGSDKENIFGDENKYQTETESESENEMRSQETKHNFLETIQVYTTLKELSTEYIFCFLTFHFLEFIDKYFLIFEGRWKQKADNGVNS